MVRPKAACGAVGRVRTKQEALLPASSNSLHNDNVQLPETNRNQSLRGFRRASVLSCSAPLRCALRLFDTDFFISVNWLWFAVFVSSSSNRKCCSILRLLTARNYFRTRFLRRFCRRQWSGKSTTPTKPFIYYFIPDWTMVHVRIEHVLYVM